MLTTNIADFIKSIPTASGSKWEAIEKYVKSADVEIKTILAGSALYDHIAALTAGDSLLVLLTNLINVTAYRNAIPFTDLIATPNGFAVVSNTNLAPASKERVERLIEWCNREIDRTTDVLIMNVMQRPAALAEWTKSAGFSDLTNCFFNTGIDFAGYFKQSDLPRKSFLDFKNDLLYCQNNVLGKEFGNAIITELLTQIRTNSLTGDNKTVLSLMKQVMAKYANGIRLDELKAQSGSFRMIYEGLKGNETYESSPEAQVHAAGSDYVNKQTDPTFFFGI